MAETKSVVSSVLLALQLCLGFWQIGKLTPVGGLIQATALWFLSFLPFGLGSYLSPDYIHLRRAPGRVFKQRICLVTTATDQGTISRRMPPGSGNELVEIRCRYMDVDHHLERRGSERNMLFVDNKFEYYITDTIWSTLRNVVDAMRPTTRVVLKGYKEFWQGVGTGSLMSFSEVLDRAILENHSIKSTGDRWVLPVNLTVSEEKLLKALNLVGLFLQTKKVHWLIPTLVSSTAAVMEFNTPLRVWIYGRINLLFCRVMRLICDSLRSRSARRQLYALGKWIENLKPSNDIQCKVVRGDVCAVIAGGAKTSQEGATLVHPNPDCFVFEQHGPYITKQFECDEMSFMCDFSEQLRWCTALFVTGEEIIATVNLECNGRDDFGKVVAFVSLMAKNKCGSLKCWDSKNRVHVRGFKESLHHYVKSGYPPVYELEMRDVVIE